MNVIAQRGFELSYFEAAVQSLSHRNFTDEEIILDRNLLEEWKGCLNDWPENTFQTVGLKTIR